MKTNARGNRSLSTGEGKLVDWPLAARDEPLNRAAGDDEAGQ
jgi:hypothetical protein